MRKQSAIILVVIGLFVMSGIASCKSGKKEQTSTQIARDYDRLAKRQKRAYQRQLKHEKKRRGK